MKEEEISHLEKEAAEYAEKSKSPFEIREDLVTATRTLIKKAYIQGYLKNQKEMEEKYEDWCKRHNIVNPETCKGCTNEESVGSDIDHFMLWCGSCKRTEDTIEDKGSNYKKKTWNT